MLFAGRLFSSMPPKIARAAAEAWARANTGLDDGEIAAYLDLAGKR